jgi:hypothetical protein
MSILPIWCEIIVICFAFSSRLAYYSQDGGAGAIREAGGTFGKKEAADEERYFRKMVEISFLQFMYSLYWFYIWMLANWTAENT